MYDLVYNLAEKIINQQPSTLIAAQGFPGLDDGEPMLTNIKLGKGKNYMEISLTTAESEPAFEWRAEITVSTDDSYRHFLLLKNGNIVETYGKQVLETDQSGQEWLMGQLKNYLC